MNSSSNSANTHACKVCFKGWRYKALSMDTEKGWRELPKAGITSVFISLLELICSLLVGSELDMWYASFLTNQFKCCNIQFVIFMTFLDPPVSQFFLDIATSSLDPFSRHPDHYWLKYNLHTIKFIQVSLSKQQFCKQMRKLFTKECNWSW